MSKWPRRGSTLVFPSGRCVPGPGHTRDRIFGGGLRLTRFCCEGLRGLLEGVLTTICRNVAALNGAWRVARAQAIYSFGGSFLRRFRSSCSQEWFRPWFVFELREENEFTASDDDWIRSTAVGLKLKHNEDSIGGLRKAGILTKLSFHGEYKSYLFCFVFCFGDHRVRSRRFRSFNNGCICEKYGDSTGLFLLLQVLKL